MFFLHTSTMKLLHLSGRKTCDYVMRKGNVWKGKTMIARWLSGAPRLEKKNVKGSIYLGTFASVKLHKSAVKRNRMRRRCREAIRRLTKDLPECLPVQLLITPRIASLDSSFELIENDVQLLLSALHVWPNRKAEPRASSTSP